MEWSASSASTVASMSSMSALSVISRQRSPGGSAQERSAATTWSAMERLRSCRAETFTDIISGRPDEGWSSHRRAWAQASSSTHAPSRSTSPVSSASGMKPAGATSPRLGCCQRTSASNPTRSPSAWTTGW